MLKQILFISVLIISVSACNKKANESLGNAKGAHFGENITAKGAVSYTDLLKQIQNKDSLNVKVFGTVEAVCQMKGCWMNIAPEAAGQSAMMVKFKDYGFFVPKDIAGRKVVLQGVAYREVTPVDELRHYAEDAGKSKEEIEAINESKEELKFMASGVIVLDAEPRK